jgi:hypothetical protein
MAQFQVNRTITSYGETTIEADSYEEAVKMASDYLQVILISLMDRKTKLK